MAGFQADTRHLDGTPMPFRTLLEFGGSVQPALAPAARDRLAATRLAFETTGKSGSRVYGCNTGVGAMKDVTWSQDVIDVFQLGLARAHHFGIGPKLPTEVVRAALAIRINTALTGYVGCSVELIEALTELMAADVIPVVRRMGSIGCADIGLMGQVAAGLTGAGTAHHLGQEMPMKEAMMLAGLRPLNPQPGDALASLSLNAVGYASAAFAVHSAAGAVRRLLAVGLCSAGALGASRGPWLAASRVGIAEHAEIGQWLLDASEPWAWPYSTNVQDPLSLRMMPQIFGSALDSLCAAAEKLARVTGVSDDNPVVIDETVLTSGGSLPIDIALALQSTQIALAHVARNSFNRCALLVNGGHGGLPLNLVSSGSIATGFGPVLKLAADLFTRVHSLAAAVSPQALVVANGIEDEATFLPLIVERFEDQIAALGHLAAVEALLAAEGMDLKKAEPRGIAALPYGAVRNHLASHTRDRPISDELERIGAELSSAEFTERLVRSAPIANRDAILALDITTAEDDRILFYPHRPAAGIA